MANRRLPLKLMIAMARAWLRDGCPKGYFDYPTVTSEQLNTICDTLNKEAGRAVITWSMGELRPAVEYRQLRLFPR